MKEASFKIKSYAKSYAKSVDIVDNNDIKKRMLNILLAGLGGLALLYLLILSNMVLNIIERRTLEADARVKSNEVADLELRYISTSSKIDLNMSATLGFSERKPEFATRKPVGLNSDKNVKLAKNEI